MVDIIHAVGDLFREFGVLTSLLIILVGVVVAVMLVHINMLRQWASSNTQAATASETRVQAVEKRQDQLLVANLNLQKSLININESQNVKLDTLVSAAADTTNNAAEQAQQSKAQTELLAMIKDEVTKGTELSKRLNDLVGSDPSKLCQLATFIKSKFPDMSDEELELLVRQARAKYVKVEEECKKDIEKDQDKQRDKPKKKS